MSAKLSGMVFDRYPVGGGEMLLALKLADNAHDDGTHIFPSVGTMAEKTRQSVRAVQYQLRRMQESGWLMLVRPARGGRNGTGYPAEYRINPDWINGAEIAPIKSALAVDGKGAEIAPNETEERVQDGAEMGAICDGMGANGDRNGCKAFAPEPSVNHQEPPKNHQPARRAPRVALHAELRLIELPNWLPADAWADWCEHREAKARDKAAPWTRPAAKVSLRRLTKLRELGHDPVACIEEAVLRGWTGLFPARDEQQQGASGTPAAPADWWKSESGYLARGAQLGVDRSKFQYFEQFKAKVCKLAGPGEWMEELLRTVSRESEERYEALYAYFNDIPRDHVAQQVAA
ncbi:helix-turn-helix domain-containing protein [Burkholderia sp. Bp9099]|uniref:helix-turn-helix domain-containing protein n=1 Tax=Burkholderia sp. Bp9099 TaxID=2184568 RepID=UPI0021AB7D60|nr:helix-turn-helix domain-containing protein [Burkholderia sp. Bp9099]